MPMSPPQVSVVIPVHNAAQRLTSEIPRVLDALADLSRQRCELIIVDDGSSDATSEVLAEWVTRFPQVRVLRHSVPRGIEAAGQTGLDAAKGDIVFIQEDNRPVRLEDMRRLFRMTEDPSVVAARAESKPRPLSNVLRQRLPGYPESEAASVTADQPETTGLQMIRRPHRHHLRGPLAPGLALRSEVLELTSIV